MTVEVHVNDALCKGCNLCVEFCPRRVFEPSSEVGRRGYFIPVTARAAECTGCMFCEHLCPELAITIVADKSRRADRQA